MVVNLYKVENTCCLIKIVFNSSRKLYEECRPGFERDDLYTNKIFLICKYWLLIILQHPLKLCSNRCLWIRWMDKSNVNILVVILHYCFTRCDY